MATHGVLTLVHPVTGVGVKVDLDSYWAGDAAEGTYTFGGLREIWFRNVYFREFDLPRRLGGVIDLGANRGLFTLLAASFAERVVAVEALPKFRIPMEHNLAINDLRNVTLLNAFAGSEAWLVPRDGRVIGFSAIVEALQGAPVDFLKVDIEGSEFGLEIGLFQSVKRLAMELHRGWGNTSDFVRRIRDCGFDCRTLDETLRPVDAVRADFLFGINRRFPALRWKRPR